MYQTSLSYKLKPITQAMDHRRILHIFFQAWVDETCNNEVQFTELSNETIMVECERTEDAIALRLKGIPDEFQNYLEIVN
jgi:hypothetical protein